MPDIRVGERRLAVAAGSNLLDALLAGGIAVPHSCRAGSCHACLVHCLQGEVEDTLPEALDPVRREAGWRLACQCRVLGDLVLQPFDPEPGIRPETRCAEPQAPIQLLHLARDHYLASELAELAGRHPQLRVNLVSAAQLPSALADLRLVPRRSMALLCGQPASVERFARHLYLAGVPRSQTLADLFLPHA